MSSYKAKRKSSKHGAFTTGSSFTSNLSEYTNELTEWNGWFSKLSSKSNEITGLINSYQTIHDKFLDARELYISLRDPRDLAKASAMFRQFQETTPNIVINALDNLKHMLIREKVCLYF